MNRNASELRILLFAFTISALVLPVGCNKSSYDVASVSGKVTIDGRPMTAGQVMFTPLGKPGSINAGKPAFGVIQSDGSFVLSTYGEEDGAVVGEHTVSVYDGSLSPRFSRLSIPGRRAVNADTDNQIDIQITTELIKQFGVHD